MAVVLYRVPPPLSDEPLVSIILVCRNGARTIHRAVESVLAQPYRNLELLVQDGLSTDGTLDILRGYGDARIKIVSEKDSCAEEAFFHVLPRCRGEIVGSCLSDEELLPNAVADAVAHLRRNPEAGALMRDTYYTDLAGKVNFVNEGAPFNLIDYLAWAMTIHFPTAFFRTAALHDIGLCTRDWPLDCAEMELSARLGDKYRLDYVPGVSAKYAQGHAGQLGSRNGFQMALAKGVARMVREFYKESWFLQGEEALRNYLASAHLKSITHNLRDDPESPGKLAELGRFLQQEMGLGREVRTTPELCRRLRRAGKSDMAINLAQQLIQENPANWEAHRLLAEMLSERGLVDLALQVGERALPSGDAEGYLSHLAIGVQSPQLDATRLAERQRKWASGLAPLGLPAWIAPAPPPSGRLRLGVHAADWGNEEALRQVIPVLRELNPHRFELTCLGGGASTSSPDLPGARIVPTASLTDGEFAAAARSYGFDVLVETSGMRPGHRWGALAARCATVQAAFLGHFAPSGVPNIDFLLADAVTIPEGAENSATEKIVRLPGCLSCFDFGPFRESEPAWVTNGFVTFGCLEPGPRLNPEVLDLWIALLNMLPQTRLLLGNLEVHQVDIHNYLRAQLEKYRIARGRLLILPRRDAALPAYFHDQIDIVLDPFPHNGTLGTAAALARGVPVVTLKGDRFASRIGASLLVAAGLPELVADTPRDYLAKAAALASDPLRLRRLRAELPGLARTHGLTDVPRFARQWENAVAGLASRPSAT